VFRFSRSSRDVQGSRRDLPILTAEILRLQATENLNLLHSWQENNPGKPIREFWDEYWRYWHGKKLMESVEAFTGFNFEKAEGMAARAAAAQKTASPGEEADDE
jgi:hypothetical protein